MLAKLNAQRRRCALIDETDSCPQPSTADAASPTLMRTVVISVANFVATMKLSRQCATPVHDATSAAIDDFCRQKRVGRQNVARVFSCLARLRQSRRIVRFKLHGKR